MSKYKILELMGVRELLRANPDMYSPDGNKMIVFQNGLFGGQMFYDHKSKKVYGLTLKEVTPLTDKDLDFLKGEYAKEQVKYLMGYNEAIDFLKSRGEWNE